MTQTAFEKLTQRQKDLYRESCGKGGRNGKHSDKVKAGRAGFAARIKKLEALNLNRIS